MKWGGKFYARFFQVLTWAAIGLVWLAVLNNWEFGQFLAWALVAVGLTLWLAVSPS